VRQKFGQNADRIDQKRRLTPNVTLQFFERPETPFGLKKKLENLRNLEVLDVLF
jgi:hypothetical protein